MSGNCPRAVYSQLVGEVFYQAIYWTRPQRYRVIDNASRADLDQIVLFSSIKAALGIPTPDRSEMSS